MYPVTGWKPWASQVFLAQRPIRLDSYAELISIQYPGLVHRLLTPELRALMAPADSEAGAGSTFRVWLPVPDPG